MQMVSLILIRWIVIYPRDSAIQRLNNRGQFLKISVLQANVCWLGVLDKIICPWKESDAGQLEILGVGGDLMCRIAAMCYLSETS